MPLLYTSSFNIFHLSKAANFSSVKLPFFVFRRKFGCCLWFVNMQRVKCTWRNWTFRWLLVLMTNGRGRQTCIPVFFLSVERYSRDQCSQLLCAGKNNAPHGQVKHKWRCTCLKAKAGVCFFSWNAGKCKMAAAAVPRVAEEQRDYRNVCFTSFRKKINVLFDAWQEPPCAWREEY